MASQSDKSNRGIYITLGMLMGAAVGMAAGILTAPKSGKETREELRLRAQQTKDNAKQQLAASRDAAADKLHKTLDKSKKVAEDMADTAKQIADGASSQVATATRKAKAETTSPLQSDT